MRTNALAALSLLAIVTACSVDAPTAPARPRTGIASASPPAAASSVGAALTPDARLLLGSYVAIGTSVSQGVRSDGLYSAFQLTSWPAQLAALAGQQMTLPLILPPGCRSPLVPPLLAGVRLSGEPAFTPPALLSCAPNAPGVVLPTENVAMNGATTFDALFTTPQNTTDAANAKLYTRILPPTMTQVDAMMAQQPKLVSVELGANELLGARSGVYIPGVTVVPFNVWLPQYRMVLDSVRKVTRFAVLVGLVDRTLSLPAFRRGAEIWTRRATFAPFNVQVASDCHESGDVLFVPVLVPTIVAQGIARAKQGLGPAVLSCANVPSSTGVQDFVLDPTEVAALDAQLRQMSAAIAAEASARGFAYFPLGAFYDHANPRVPFDAVQIMTSSTPFGPLMSLDGVHPAAGGAAILAAAAAQALNARYHLGLP